MADGRPFHDAAALFAEAERSWWGLEERDWLEAFATHPRIGESRGAQPAQGARWSEAEQAGVRDAEARTLDALAEGNRAYAERFGFTYIVCAAGRSADELLGLLRARLGHDRAEELRIAAGEQARITELRLGRLIAR